MKSECSQDWYMRCTAEFLSLQKFQLLFFISIHGLKSCTFKIGTVLYNGKVYVLGERF